jgi:hypothetical protein
MCDRLLDEVGRRRHMFAWLRAPGAGAGEWLAVDAYYPRARLVVMCGPSPGRHDCWWRRRGCWRWSPADRELSGRAYYPQRP